MTITFFLMHKLRLWKYLIVHWLFRWTLDADDAITFTIAGVLNFTKYKEHTIVKMGKGWKPAPNWVQPMY